MTTTLRCSIALTILAILSLSTTTANAQEVTRMPDTSRHSVGLDTGLENAFIARATYAHRLELGSLDGRLFARATLPFVTPDLGDWAVDGGLRVTPLSWRDLRPTLLAGPVLRRSQNELFSGTGMGLSATILAGYESPVWGLSAEGGYEQMLATHLSHSDRYRETFYADAKDGWYAVTGSIARAGLRGGARFGALEIAARAGMNTTGQFQPVTPPFYFTLGTSYAF